MAIINLIWKSDPSFLAVSKTIDIKTWKSCKLIPVYFLYKMQYLLSNLFIFLLVFCKSKFKLLPSRWIFFWYRIISSNKPSGPDPLTISSDKCAIVDVKTWKSSKFIPVYFLFKMQYLLSNLFIFHLVFCKSKFKLQSSRWISFWYRIISSNKPSGPDPLTISSDKCAIVDVKTWKSSKFIPVYLLVKMQYLLSNLFIYVLVFC